MLKRHNAAAAALCKWVRAMYVYDAVAKVVAPKKRQLAEAETQLQETAESHAQARAEVEVAEKAHQDLQAQSAGGDVAGWVGGGFDTLRSVSGCLWWFVL